MLRKSLLVAALCAGSALGAAGCSDPASPDAAQPAAPPPAEAEPPADAPPADAPPGVDPLCGTVPIDVVTEIGNQVEGRGPAGEPSSDVVEGMYVPASDGEVIDVSGTYVRCTFHFPEPEDALREDSVDPLADDTPLIITYVMDGGADIFATTRDALTQSGKVVAEVPGVGEEAFLARTLTSTVYFRQGDAMIMVDGLVFFDDEIVQDLAAEVAARL
jgi:hypothetical protein